MGSLCIVCLAEKERLELFFVFSEIVVNSVNEQIVIQMQSGIEIKLPCFKKGTMYQGMEEDKRYTIKELGL